MQIRHGDRRSHQEPGSAAKKSATAISGRNPTKLRAQSDSQTDADQPANDCSREQSSFARGVAENRAKDSPETGKRPSRDDERKWPHVSWSSFLP
jgi:hypothetical protein